MSDLQKYITKRKKTDKEFAKDYDKGFENFKIGENFAERARKGDWEKGREILAKESNIKIFYA